MIPSILLDPRVLFPPGSQHKEGVSRACSQGYPISFPIAPALCMGEGAVGQDEPFLLHKARQPAALGL